MNLGSSNVRTLTFCNLVRMNLVTYLSHASPRVKNIHAGIWKTTF